MSDPGMLRRFVILDRDGTVIVEKNYLSDPEGVKLLESAAEGLRAMRDLGLGLILTTNQSGVGRGFYDLETLERIHGRLSELLAAEGVALDGIYYCPHTPDDACSCRKPEIGMVERAVGDLGFDPCQAFMIGDKACDIELGRNIGAVTILTRTGYGASVESDIEPIPDYTVNDLSEAAFVIRNLVEVDEHRRNAERMFSRSLADENTKVRVCVPVVIRDPKGAILLEKRSDCGLWGLPGGRLEPGESIIETACREILEETGLSIRVTRLIGAYSGPEDRIITFPDNVVQIVDILVEAEVLSGQLICSEESLELRYFAPDEFPEEGEVIPAARRVLHDLTDGNFGVIG